MKGAFSAAMQVRGKLTHATLRHSPMPTDANLVLLTERDLDILAALDASPLTAAQLETLSRTFATPFLDSRRVRERLRALVESNRVRAFRYATAGPGAPNYYVLSPLGFHLLHGHAADLPARRSFGPIGIARQRHTHALAQFFVHTAVAAHRAGIHISNLGRENTVRLPAGDESLYPDLTFALTSQGGRPFNFHVELDNRSERVCSEKAADSWQRKIKLYESYALQAPHRFRVLIVATGGDERLRHILNLAASLSRNPQRALFYGITLDFYLRNPDAVTAPCWIDHRAAWVPLVPVSSGLKVSANAARDVRQSSRA